MFRSTDAAEAGRARARGWLRSGRVALREKRWDDAVFNAQMAAEQAAKSFLILLGIDYPKEHDVSGLLFDLEARRDLPRWFRALLPDLASTVRELARARGAASYGFELGLGPEVFRNEAPRTLQKAEEAVSACERLAKELARRKVSGGR